MGVVSIRKIRVLARDLDLDLDPQGHGTPLGHGKWTELCVSAVENLLTEVYCGTRTALLICVWLAACAGSVAKNNKLLARHEL